MKFSRFLFMHGTVVDMFLSVDGWGLQGFSRWFKAELFSGQLRICLARSLLKVGLSNFGLSTSGMGIGLAMFSAFVLFSKITQMLHVWNINRHLGHFWGKCR